MDQTVVAVNFGKEERDAARKLADLLQRVSVVEDELLTHPLRLFEEASKKIVDLQRALRHCEAALFNRIEPLSRDIDQSQPLPNYFQKISVYLDDWKKYEECARRVREASASL